MIYLTIIQITLITVLLIDITGFVTEMETMLAKWLKVRNVHIPKPFSCSLCMSHHIGLIYLLIAGQFTLTHYLFLLALACMSSEIAGVMNLIKDTITLIITKIEDIIF